MPIVEAALFQMLLDPLFTGKLSPNATVFRPASIHATIADHRLRCGLPKPNVLEQGRILWIDANPAVDTVLDPYGLSVLNEIARRKHFLGTIISPFNDFEYPDDAVRYAIDRFKPDVIGLSVRNLDDAVAVKELDGDSDFIDTSDYLARVVQLTSALRSSFTGPLILGGAAMARSPTTAMRALGIKFGVQGPGEQFLALSELTANAKILIRRNTLRMAFLSMCLATLQSFGSNASSVFRRRSEVHMAVLSIVVIAWKRRQGSGFKDELQMISLTKCSGCLTSIMYPTFI
jgi:hypothetical protein